MQIRDKRKAGWFWIANEVLDALELNPYQFTVYAALARFAGNENQQSWASIKTLAKRTGMSEAKCRQSLRELEARGLLSTEQRYQESGGQTSNLYTLLPTNRATLGTPHHAVLPAPPHDVAKPDSLNQTPSNSTSDDKSSEVLVKKHQPAGRNLIKKQLEDYFVKVSGIPLPALKTARDRKAAGERWWKPLLYIASLVNDDIPQAQKLIDSALRQLDDNNYTVSAPASIQNTAASLHGQQVRRSGPGRILKVA